jgi:hypothetical protein
MIEDSLLSGIAWAQTITAAAVDRDFPDKQ